MNSSIPAPVAASIDTTSPEFLAQKSRQRLCHDLCAGAEGMRQGGALYVERGEGESDAAFRARLDRPALLNSFKRTLDFLRGQVFQKSVALGEDADDEFQAWAEDVDRKGSSLTTWSAETFQAGLRDGVVYCLVDYSRVRIRTAESGAVEYLDEASGEWRPKTAAADAAAGWAPYLVRIEAEDVLDVWTEARDGRDVATHIRWMEHGLEPSPLSEWSRQAVDRIHAWWPDRWQVYARHGGAGMAWELEAEGQNSLGYIPLCCFRPGERRGPSTAAPALADLAELNRRHWAASAGHAELLEFVRRPVWFGRGIGRIRNADGTESDVVVGAGRLISADDTAADLKSVGIDAASVQASAQELETLKTEMAMYGLQLLQPKGGAAQTATEVERNASENNSTLAAWALGFGDFLENVLRDVAHWRGLEDGPSVAVNSTFSRRTTGDYLLELFRAGAVSLETLLALLKASGVLPDDFDVEGELERQARSVLLNGEASGIASLAATLKGAAAGSPAGVNGAAG